MPVSPTRWSRFASPVSRASRQGQCGQNVEAAFVLVFTRFLDLAHNVERAKRHERYGYLGITQVLGTELLCEFFLELRLRRSGGFDRAGQRKRNKSALVDLIVAGERTLAEYQDADLLSRLQSRRAGGSFNSRFLVLERRRPERRADAATRKNECGNAMPCCRWLILPLPVSSRVLKPAGLELLP